MCSFGTDIGCRAYPTGFNRLPDFYAWDGVLPHTISGSATCVTASATRSSKSFLEIPYTYISSRSPSTYTTITSTYTVKDAGATPLPSVEGLPTRSVYLTDVDDPRGWNYCYAFGRGSKLGRAFASYFSDDDVFTSVLRNCTPYELPDGIMFPAGNAVAVSYLLDETTSYINSPKTGILKMSRPDAAEPSQTSIGALLDPIQITSVSPDAEQSASAAEPSDDRPAEDDLTNTISEDEANEIDDSPTPLRNTGPTTEPEVASGTTQASKSSDRNDDESRGASLSKSATRTQSNTKEQLASPDVHNSEEDSGLHPPPRPSVAMQTTTPYNDVPLDTFNSLIQEVGRLQSSRQGEDLEGSGETATQGALHTAATTTTSLLFPPITIGAFTATVNSEGNYMIGTHTLQPTGSPYELQGTTYSFDATKSALVINGIFTYPVEASQRANGDLQAPTLTLNGVTIMPDRASNYVVGTQTLKPGRPAITVSGTRISLSSNAATIVFGSETSVLSTSRGIGDYVWAGIAGMLSAGSSPILSNGVPSPLPSATKPAANQVLSQQSSTSFTGVQPTSQPALNVSSSSNLIETASENNSGRSTNTASLAICILSLLVTIFA
jgi:hypothetical protein